MYDCEPGATSASDGAGGFVLVCSEPFIQVSSPWALPIDDAITLAGAIMTVLALAFVWRQLRTVL